ncbi:hypothetical protein BAU15_11160 [Enterococcus sp. JM4C]|uniref:hypothetical protein n=1 Tax=Candidatus Enterococcus huntleyi TaxID=1857217 RepID=UPI00137AD31D|nr:hypothetical protein [Enterococcus sp. JM4C]KAF1298677.1 hypothetical protein BAU15_11160 [Enterococcus sp. JM4C]
MKKGLLSSLCIVGLTLILVGCSNQNKKSEARSESSQISTTSTQGSGEDEGTEMTTSEDKSHVRSKFTATLSEDATQSEKDSEQIRLILSEVNAEEDPENILPMLSNDGVILNVKKDQLGEDTSIEVLKKGSKITFVLKGIPMMTMSLPPQVAGNSVEQVTAN